MLLKKKKIHLYAQLSQTFVFRLLLRLDLVRGTGAPAFRHRDVDDLCSETSCGLLGGFSARFPRAVWERVTTRAPRPGSRIRRGGRCTFKRDVPPHSGILVRGQPFGSLGPPQAHPPGFDDGEASRRLVRACCCGAHSQVSCGGDCLVRMI